MRGSVDAVGERGRWTIALPRLAGADASTKALRLNRASRSGRWPTAVVFGVIWTCTTSSAIWRPIGQDFGQSRVCVGVESSQLAVLFAYPLGSVSGAGGSRGEGPGCPGQLRRGLPAGAAHRRSRSSVCRTRARRVRRPCVPDRGAAIARKPWGTVGFQALAGLIAALYPGVCEWPPTSATPPGERVVPSRSTTATVGGPPRTAEYPDSSIANRWSTN